MQVLTRTGYMDASLCQGQEVLAYDRLDGHPVYNTVVSVEATTATEFSCISEPVLDEAGEVVVPATELSDLSWYRINGVLFFAMQSIWVNDNVAHASSVQVGDTIYDDTNQDLTVISVEKLDLPDEIFYRLVVDGDHSFIADGISLHNASRFWVGGAGNWDTTTTHWSFESGGVNGSTAPTSADDVTFDTASASGNYTVAIPSNVAGHAIVCSNPVGYVLTFSGSGGLNCYDSLVLASGVLVSVTGSFYAQSSSLVSLTTNGVSISWVLTVVGSSTLRLMDDLICTTRITVNQSPGTFDVNGHNVTFTGANPSLSAYAGYTYSFVNLTVSYAGRSSFTLSTDLTVSNTFTYNGYNATTLRGLILSNAPGVQRTVTAATVVFTNMDFIDINGAGAANWDMTAITGLAGNCGGNSGITFLSSQTQYWFHGASASYNWSDARWYLGSGGTGGTGRIPLAQDDVIFDRLSFPSTGKTVSLNVPRPGRTIDFSDVANAGTPPNPTLSVATNHDICGSLKLITGMTVSGSGYVSTFNARVDSEFITAGKSWNHAVNIRTAGATFTFTGAFSSTSAVGISVTGGTLILGGDLTAAFINTQGSAARGVNLGSYNVTLTGVTNPIRNDQLTGLTWDAGTSNIKFTGNLGSAAGPYMGGLTYYNIWVATAGTNNCNFFTSGFVCNELKIDAGHAVRFVSGQTITVNSLILTGSAGSRIVLAPVAGGVTAYTISQSSGTVSADYCDISYCTATGGAYFYANHSINYGGNLGWAFEGSSRIFTCGWEEDFPDAAHSYWSYIVNATYDTTHVRGLGSWSGKVHGGGGGTNYFHFGTMGSRTAGTVWLRVYVYFETIPDISLTTGYLLRFANVSNASSALVRVRSDGSLILTNTDDSSTITAPAGTITGGAWHCIRVRNKIGLASNGEWELKVGSTSYGSLTGKTTTVTALAGVSFGLSATGDVWYDDAAINDDSGTVENSWPSDCDGVVILSPASDVAVAWTKAGSSPAATNYEGVDEIPGAGAGFNDGVDYNTDANTTNYDRFSLTTVPSGISPKLLDIYGRVGSDTTTAKSLVFQAWDESGVSQDGPPVGCNVVGWRTSLAGVVGTHENMPIDVSGKTVTQLNLWNIGYKGWAGAALNKWVSALWANLEYTAAGASAVSNALALAYESLASSAINTGVSPWTTLRPISRKSSD